MSSVRDRVRAHGPVLVSVMFSLRGPALVGGSAAAESALVAVAGAGWAVRATVRSRPGLVLGVLGATEMERPAAPT